MADKKESSLEALKAGVDNRMKTRSTRRGFLKKAVFAGVAATTTAAVAKKTVDLIPGENPQAQYLRDVLPGDGVLSKREYVVMSAEEKTALVKTLEDNYKKEA
ncbi:MAG TPA: hypothetical protein VNK06_04445 [Thermodesulfobacteriota bacterium]|nr:hypothetical protein [Thermodesulfobacteriota bacterium]